ncbi:hypothetical protein PVAP13_3NG091200 [Panicum virgatum]|uniref:Uncharacterized protein n=1 Tax=Panicum virgatum TaxID=38727 RepID=A0A8T0U8G2_PANVG|nr:hypothetical protein PVAP13_3NG091200 [Panicum virgatum]KAG2620412.1 hypothetical protein PVAP13_3NG091200 [Panicum virgatum]
MLDTVGHRKLVVEGFRKGAEGHPLMQNPDAHGCGPQGEATAGATLRQGDGCVLQASVVGSDWVRSSGSSLNLDEQNGWIDVTFAGSKRNRLNSRIEEVPDLNMSCLSCIGGTDVELRTGKNAGTSTTGYQTC